MSKNRNSISATEYIRRGPIGRGAIILRAAMDADDPESWQSLWKKKYGNMTGFPYKELGFAQPPVCKYCSGTGVAEPCKSKHLLLD